MKNKCKRKAKSLDMFGQKVSLIFGEEGETFNTSYGIFTSIAILLVVGLYSGY